MPKVEGIEQNFEHIVLNLVLNAMQAIDHKDGEVQISTKYNKGENRAILLVSDNGTGIDPAIGSKIFEPFVTSRHTNGGTGLGLSITHNLIKAYNGEIDYTSETGKGTVFEVSFPCID